MGKRLTRAGRDKGDDGEGKGMGGVFIGFEGLVEVVAGVSDFAGEGKIRGLRNSCYIYFLL